MIEVPFNIVTNNKPGRRFVFNFETLQEAISFFEKNYFKYDPDNPSIMTKSLVGKNGVAAIAFAIIPEVTVPEEPYGYELCSIEPEVLP